MITSKTNNLIKHIKSLHTKKYRDLYKEYFVEGIKLVTESINENQNIIKLIICDDLFKDNLNSNNYEIEHVTKPVFEYISDTETPQGIMSIIKMNQKSNISGDTIFALDNIQDPGNLGTIIRTLDCARNKNFITI